MLTKALKSREEEPCPAYDMLYFDVMWLLSGLLVGLYAQIF